MKNAPSNTFFKFLFVVAGLGLLSAFSYPLVQEGYQKVGSKVYNRVSQQILEQSLSGYLSLRPNVDWDSSTTTLEILTDLQTGIDRDFDGAAESFLPSSLSVDELAHNYRIIFKSNESYKVVLR